MKRPTVSRIDQQLAAMLMRMQQALNAGNWDQLAELDAKLQQALPKIQGRRSEPDIQHQLRQLNAFYSEMIAAGETEKAATQRQITQQAGNREGVLAYLQHQ
ncbi:hypothetical protein [Photobacterium aquae]|nr:hypothetical protein [Photobacterium aquae]